MLAEKIMGDFCEIHAASCQAFLKRYQSSVRNGDAGRLSVL